MIINKDTWTVVRRELKVGFNRKFIFSTIFIPLIMAAIMATQISLGQLETTTATNITVVTEQNNKFQHLLEEYVTALDLVEKNVYQVSYKQIAIDDFDQLLEDEKAALLDDDFRSVFLVPNAAMTDKKITFYSANTSNGKVRENMGSAIDKALNKRYFELNNMGNVDTNFIQTDIAVSGVKVTESGTENESWGPIILGVTLAFLLLFGVMFNSVPVMNVVANEKASRVYEVLLTSLKPRDILWGKVIGVSIVGVTQMVIWLIALGILVTMLQNFVDVSHAFHMSLNPVVALYFIVNFAVGLTLFLSLYAGFSSAYDNAGDAGAVLYPLYFIILLPFYTVFAVLGNPAHPVISVLSVLPITSLYLMPARMLLIDVPFWQLFLSLAGNAVLLYLSVNVAGRIYRASILSTGNTPSLRQLFMLLKRN